MSNAHSFVFEMHVHRSVYGTSKYRIGQSDPTGGNTEPSVYIKSIVVALQLPAAQGRSQCFQSVGGLIGEESMHGNRGSAPIWGSGGYAPVGSRCKALVGVRKSGEDFAQLLNWCFELSN